MPLTTSASKAFPSSSNSRVLSESASASVPNPCKSPDSLPESPFSVARAEIWLDARFLFRVVRVLVREVFAANRFLTALVCFLLLPFFGLVRVLPRVALWLFRREAFFALAPVLVCFLFVFLRSGIVAVYHWPARFLALHLNHSQPSLKRKIPVTAAEF